MNKKVATHVLVYGHLKCQAKFVADYILFFPFYFSEKINLDISCELYAKQTIHICQDLFSLKNKKKKYILENVVYCICDWCFKA